jgi:hypothetical protein
MKYENNDEYDGQWKNSKRHGDGVYKEASTGRIERIIIEEDEYHEVIEVIEEGSVNIITDESKESSQICS